MGTFVVPFRVLSQKEFDGRKCVVVEILVLLRGEKNSSHCPQNRILVPLRISFQNFQQAPQEKILRVANAMNATYVQHMKGKLGVISQVYNCFPLL